MPVCTAACHTLGELQQYPQSTRQTASLAVPLTILLIAGIFEELAFYFVVLHGLRRSIHPETIPLPKKISATFVHPRKRHQKTARHVLSVHPAPILFQIAWWW